VKRRVHYTVVLKKVGHIHHEQSNLKETYLYVILLSSLKQRSSRLFHDWPVDSDYTKQGLKGSGLELAYYSPFSAFPPLCFRFKTEQLLDPLSNSFQIEQAV
jgi:hypothetical protein